MRRWLRPLWVILALLFLLEAWLWDHLEPLVARVVNLIPWDALKVRSGAADHATCRPGRRCSCSSFLLSSCCR